MAKKKVVRKKKKATTRTKRLTSKTSKTRAPKKAAKPRVKQARSLPPPPKTLGKRSGKQNMLQKPNISLFILAYNEEENIPLTVELATEFLASRANKWEIILIDDHSSDKTLDVARSLKRRYPNIVIVRHHENRGYGRTQKTGFLLAKYDLVTYLPGDNQLRPDALEIMLDTMERTRTDIIIGTRHRRQDSFRRLFLAGLYNFGLNLMFALHLKDLDSVKIIRKEVLDSIQLMSKSANVDVEFLVKAKRLGYKIREVAVPSYPRTAGLATGNNVRVVAKQFYELWRFWLRIHLHV